MKQFELILYNLCNNEVTQIKKNKYYEHKTTNTRRITKANDRSN